MNLCETPTADLVQQHDKAAPRPDPNRLSVAEIERDKQRTAEATAQEEFQKEIRRRGKEAGQKDQDERQHLRNLGAVHGRVWAESGKNLDAIDRVRHEQMKAVCELRSGIVGQLEDFVETQFSATGWKFDGRGRSRPYLEGATEAIIAVRGQL